MQGVTERSGTYPSQSAKADSSPAGREVSSATAKVKPLTPGEVSFAGK
ncbi:MAG: hypothetical protein IKM46_09115 [Clostridia bacterium]|nr:hypothetical protein [Clostridia bacterium]